MNIFEDISSRRLFLGISKADAITITDYIFAHYRQQALYISYFIFIA